MSDISHLESISNGLSTDEVVRIIRSSAIYKDVSSLIEDLSNPISTDYVTIEFIREFETIGVYVVLKSYLSETNDEKFYVDVPNKYFGPYEISEFPNLVERIREFNITQLINGKQRK